MRSRNVEGRILYTSKKPDRMDQPRGHETFLFTHHSDGATTLRAHCEIEEPDPSVMRDVVYGLNPQGRPADCAVRLTVGDRFMGSGWFRFGNGFIECESYGPSVGRVSQRVDLEQPIGEFGTRPIVADGYLLSRLEWREAGERRMLEAKACSRARRSSVSSRHPRRRRIGRRSREPASGPHGDLRSAPFEDRGCGLARDESPAIDRGRGLSRSSAA